MSNVFYTSDLHIGHNLVSGIRGFTNPDGSPSTSWHDQWAAQLWDSVVKPEDTVYVLGDISINGAQRALDWIEKRPGTKHLISGNHDPVHPMFHSKARKLLPWWHQYFETIQPFMRMKLLGQTVMLSHFPYWSYGDGPGRETARYEEYRLPEQKKRPTLLMHGHTHGQERDHGDQLHVGLDAWRAMVSQDTVLRWICERRQNVMHPDLVRQYLPKPE